MLKLTPTFDPQLQQPHAVQRSVDAGIKHYNAVGQGLKLHDQLCLTENFDWNFDWSNKGITVEITGVDCSVQQTSYQSNNVSESKLF